MLSIRSHKYFFTAYSFVVSLLLVAITGGAFQAIIDNAFAWEEAAGSTAFYLVPGKLTHLHIFFLVTAIVLAAVVTGRSVVYMIELIFLKQTFKFAVYQWLTALLLIALVTAGTYYIIITPVKSVDVGNIGFTLTDGTVADTGLTPIQHYWFFALALAGFLSGIVISFSHSILKKDMLAISLLQVAAVAYTFYQVLTHQAGNVIIGCSIVVANTVVQYMYVKRSLA